MSIGSNLSPGQCVDIVFSDWVIVIIVVSILVLVPMLIVLMFTVLLLFIFLNVIQNLRLSNAPQLSQC